MNKIEGTKITLTRGDSFYTRVSARTNIPDRNIRR